MFVKLVIHCHRCGTVSSSARWKRWRCRKCKARVDSETVFCQVRLYEVSEGRRRLMTPDEFERGMHSWAVRSGSHGNEPCPDCERFGGT